MREIESGVPEQRTQGAQRSKGHVGRVPEPGFQVRLRGFELVALSGGGRPQDAYLVG